MQDDREKTAQRDYGRTSAWIPYAWGLVVVGIAIEIIAFRGNYVEVVDLLSAIGVVFAVAGVGWAWFLRSELSRIARDPFRKSTGSN